MSVGQVVTVGLLTSYIRQLFESDDFLGDLWVEGEVSQIFAAGSGHLYFTLKDDVSQIKCVAFRREVSRFRFVPRQGDQVAVHGRLTVYERDGAYQLYVDLVQSAGLGLQALQLALLKQQLTDEGLFDPSRKRPIPAMPACIGVVTSPDGAVWHDIQNVLRRRYPLVELILSPTPVQGDAAPEGIVRALQALQDDGRAEVIIVARGGGSIDDLWSFNDERVVRAVFASRIPVVSGVGHETDWTLVDEVADLRAPTPSAAAEVCSPSILDLMAGIGELKRTMRRSAVQAIREAEDALIDASEDLDRLSPFLVLERERTRLLTATSRLSSEMSARLLADRNVVKTLVGRIAATFTSRLTETKHRQAIAATRLAAINPREVIRRGYAFVERLPAGSAISTAGQLTMGDRVSLQFADGQAIGTIEETSTTRTRSEEPSNARV